ncbi:MAG: conjugal transfer protein TraF [Gammaproteobacteria bacterium]|nr:conjugal transfer protein TraF [Gammaproteobacteria bacterium]MDH5801570.1 conjugal transfer protein TraF [Gammaproteobacteria bacterium]
MKVFKKTLITTAILALGSGSGWAGPINHPSGSNLTYGYSSNGQSIMSDINNPAAGAAILEKDGEGQFRFGLISSIGFGAEIGDVAELYNEVDAVSQSFQGDFANLLGPVPDVGTALSTMSTEFNRVNNFLGLVEEQGYAKAFVSGHVPLMPLVITSKGLGGSLVLDANFTAGAQMNFLGQDIAFDPTEATANQLFADFIAAISGSPTTDNQYINGDFLVNYTGATGQYSYAMAANDSSIVIKAGGIAEVALGYSTLMMGGGDNSLFFGLRGKYYQTELYRYVQAFDLNTAGSQTTFDNADTTNATSTTGFGVDVGLLWAMRNMRLGATLTNINEPSFDYNTTDTGGYTYTDPRISAEIAKGATYTMESQLKFEAAIYSDSRNWVLGATFDANPIEDAFGAEYQWATASVAYASDTFIIPGLRAGVRKNLAGSELTYANVGMTWLFINLDAGMAMDKIVIDDQETSRAAMVNLGVQFTF